MGRLTDSLRKASAKLNDIESGIDRMSSLSEDLAKNTANVADASLKLGYAYAKTEEKLTANASPQDRTADDKTAEIAKLSHQLEKIQNSQNSLQTWNDLYRIQQTLVVQYLQEQDDIEPAVLEQVQQILKLKSIKQAPTLASQILSLTPIKVWRLLKKQVKYKKHLLNHPDGNP